MKKHIIIGVSLLLLISLSSASYSMTSISSDTIPNKIECDTYNVIIQQQNDKQIVFVESKIKNKDDLEKQKTVSTQKINNYREEVKSEQETSLLTNAVATVTFNTPICIETLRTILNESNGKLKDFETKFINDQGVWVTGSFRRLDENLINKVINDIVESGKEQKLVYEGITSARIRIDLLSNNYEEISANKNVYLVDTTDTFIRLENRDYINQMKIRIPDLAWEIDKIK